MSPYFAGWDERTLDLAIDRFTVGLNDQQNDALAGLADDASLREFENVLAAIHLASLADVQAPPAGLRNRLEHLGREQISGSAAPASAHPTPQPTRPTAFSYTGWLVAAGILLCIALFGPSVVETPQGPNAGFEALVASATDLIRIDWTATDDPAATGASGEVIWSSSKQEGYMRFENLTPNVAAESQFQLWIFDPTRADWEAKPVDGGVFDIPTDGEVIVPIDPKLAVRETALFAVTIEEPGGVVVSEREHLILTAAL